MLQMDPFLESAVDRETVEQLSFPAAVFFERLAAAR
jgi:hypothetical protein